MKAGGTQTQIRTKAEGETRIEPRVAIYEWYMA